MDVTSGSSFSDSGLISPSVSYGSNVHDLLSPAPPSFCHPSLAELSTTPTSNISENKQRYPPCLRHPSPSSSSASPKRLEVPSWKALCPSTKASPSPSPPALPPPKTTANSHSHSLRPRRRHQDRTPPPPHQPSPRPQEQQHRLGQLGRPSPRHRVRRRLHPRRHPGAARIGVGDRKPATDPVASRRRGAGESACSETWCY